jgi:hypothetical protein
MFMVLLIVLVWSFVPIAVKQWGRVPHTHVLIGNITEAELAAHIANEAAHAESAESLHFHNGWILSVPFGDLGTFLAFLLVLAPAVVVILALPMISISINAHELKMGSPFFEIPQPPPRLFC